jgi:hypothetical protein
MKPYAYTKANPETLFVQQQLLRERGRKAISASFMLVGVSLFTYVGGYYYLWNIKEAEIAKRPGLVQVLANAPASAFTNTSIGNNNASLEDPTSASALAILSYTLLLR